MYAIFLLLLLAGSAALVISGINKQKRTPIIAGIALAVFTGLFFGILSFWGEALWFSAVGYEQRFWKVILTKIIVAVGGALGGGLLLAAITWKIPRRQWPIRTITLALAAYITGQWALINWDKILLFLNSVATGTTDPILSRDTGFYLFKLPVYNSLYGLLLTLTVIALIASFLAAFVRFSGAELQLRAPHHPDADNRDPCLPLYISAGILLIVLAWGKYLDRFNLMFSSLGIVTGPGWTDARIRLPLYLVMIALILLAAVALLVPPLRNRLSRLASPLPLDDNFKPLLPLVGVAAFTVAAWFILLGLVPGVFQWLKVQPNEITLEQPYIKHNIEFTRRGFALNRIEEKRFPVSETFTRQTVDQNRNLFDNIRLWDWRALDSVYEQFQEIRLYYEFADVDIDRYTFQGKYRQVMVSAREMQLQNIPAQSQTFVNKRFKYTHGIGLTLTSVSDFTPEGLPNLLIKDIPPKSEYPELEVQQPRIYYGELTDTHVIVNSEEKELDYPSGEQNVYNRYTGSGGVQIKNLWRKFLFGWKFDGTRLLLSTYPNPDSRIMFHRQIMDRVNTIAPFLKFDDDPYIVLADGRLYWIIDAYTVSGDYPYSEPIVSPRRSTFARNAFSRGRTDLSGVNYMRNSVKTVVDAFNGSVSFYIFEPDDPLINAWSKIFPAMFQSREDMPPALLNHIRYPADLLLIQGLVYTKYHMTDPTVFYNQEDLWVRATEKYYNRTQPVQPYYIMWEMPGSDDPQYVLMLPFTPKNKQVLIGWIAGMCDPANYGRLLAYKFPKEKRVLGTQQVETKIDQDRNLSAQLSLWDQRGSRVIRGNVLVIPIEDTLIYVEPIYLQAETAAYPELRLVAVMHNDVLSYAESFDEALKGLYMDKKPQTTLEPLPDETTVNQLVRNADTAFNNYLQELGRKNFTQAARELEKLQQALENLAQTTGKTEKSPDQ